MLNELMSVIDRLIKLKEYRDRRFRSFFKDVIEPAFNDLLLVHSDYIKMFEQTYQLLPKGPRPISRIVRVSEESRPQKRLAKGRRRIPPLPAQDEIIFASEEECPEYYG